MERDATEVAVSGEQHPSLVELRESSGLTPMNVINGANGALPPSV